MVSRWLLVGSLVASFSTAAFAGDSANAPHDIYRVAPVARLALDRATVRAKLAEARADNLNRFRAYQANGVFPTNAILRGKLNVWRDDEGHLCAAATIINQSGQAALVQLTGDNDNFVRLGTVTEGPLLDWMLTSGLTQQEIAMIQEPFMGVAEPDRTGRMTVDAKRAAAEHARLAAKYKQVEAALVKASAASLDRATDRLMANQTLAVAFVRGDTGPVVDTSGLDRVEPMARFAQPPPR